MPELEEVKNLIDGIGTRTKLSMGELNTAFDYYKELFVDTNRRPPIKKANCGSCTLRVLGALRQHIGYPSKRDDVSPSLRQRRLEICEKCDKLTTFAKQKQCSECGCFVEIKARFKMFSCPVGKWPNE